MPEMLERRGQVLRNSRCPTLIVKKAVEQLAGLNWRHLARPENRSLRCRERSTVARVAPGYSSWINPIL